MPGSVARLCACGCCQVPCRRPSQSGNAARASRIIHGEADGHNTSLRLLVCFMIDWPGGALQHANPFWLQEGTFIRPGTAPTAGAQDGTSTGAPFTDQASIQHAYLHGRHSSEQGQQHKEQDMQQQILEAGLQHVVSRKAACVRVSSVDNSLLCESTARDIQRLLSLVQAATLAIQKALGWSEAALMEGARDLGLSPAAASMLERGPAQLVEVCAMAATVCRCSPPSGRLNVYSLFRNLRHGAALLRAPLRELVRHQGLSTSSSVHLESLKPCALQLHNDRSFWQLAQQLEESHSVLSVMKTPERVKAGVRMRLEMNIPYIGAYCGWVFTV